MALTKIKGQNFRVVVDCLGDITGAIPEATSCQVSITGNMESARTKDTEGTYEEEQMVSRGWNVQVDSFDATPEDLIGIISMFNLDLPSVVGWTQTETTPGTQNRTPVSAGFNRTGHAHLTSFSIVANNRQTMQLSMQFQGSGALS